MVLVVLLLLTAPYAVFAQKQLLIQTSFNPTQTDQGVYVTLSGRVFDLSNDSMSNAVVSIEVINPQGTSVHVAVAYTGLNGLFQDTFYVASTSPAGNYTAFLAAGKPGYDTAHLTLTFAYSTPDFSVESASTSLAVEQGQTGSVTVTVLALRGYREAVNLTAINLPSGVTVQFSPGSLVPSGSATATVQVSFTAQTGNYSLQILAVSGSVTHQTTLQLTIQPNPVLSMGAGLGVLVAAVAVVLVVRSRKSRREIVDELLRQANADRGYVATVRAIARLEELRSLKKIDESTYQRLRKEYEKRLEKSK
jgi:hypothetical protein